MAYMENSIQNFLGIKTGPTVLEKVFFRVSHPIFPTLLFMPLGFLFIWVGQGRLGYPWYGLLGLFLLGLLLWTLVEYCLHRFIFHLTSIREPYRTFASSLHIEHHRIPEDKSLIIAPPTVTLVYSFIIFGILMAFTWNLGMSFIILAGIQLGYLAYEWVHYGSHNFKMKNSLLKYLKHYHLHHHFKQPKEAYGVTVPLWDWVFGSHR